jgi:hypothetical protein
VAGDYVSLTVRFPTTIYQALVADAEKHYRKIGPQVIYLLAQHYGAGQTKGEKKDDLAITLNGNDAL